jgi:methyl-accepting chemotaxis protein
VVAEEVRNLAMRSAEAAKNTAALIEDAVKHSEGGVALNAEVLKQLQEIDARVEKVGAVMAEIAAAGAQQSQGVAQINGAVEQMNAVTQQVAANAEEAASAAEELHGQAQQLTGMVGEFQISAAGSARPAGTAARVPQRSAAAKPASRPARNEGAALKRSGNGRPSALAR